MQLTSTVNMRANQKTAKISIPCIKFKTIRSGTSASKTVLRRPEAVASISRCLIPDDGREHFGVLLLSSALYLLGYHEVGIGTADAVLSMVRDIFGPALRVPGCVGIITVHNHPSGRLRPSNTDLVLTRSLLKASRLLSIRLHDHVIISHGTLDYYSFADHWKKITP